MTPDTALDTLEQPDNQTPSTTGMTTRVVKGSFWTLAGQVAPLLVSLVTTPFVIRMLGTESYGVLILVGLIPTYFGFADFGMGMASTKFGSGAYADGDAQREARIVRTALLIALCGSVPVAVVFFVFSGEVISLFNVPPHLVDDTSLALKFASITFVLNFLAGIVNTPQFVRLRMDLNTMVVAGFRILGLLATPFAIFIAGVPGALFVLMVASFLTLAGSLLVSGRLNRHLFQTSIEPDAVRPMLKFGAGLVGASIAGVVLVNAEKGILAAVVSAAALAYYSVAATIANLMTMFSNSMVQSLVPAFSQLQAADKQDHLNSLYSRAIRLTLIWLVPAVVFLTLVAKPFFAIWAGEDFARESTLPFYILLAGIAINIVAFVPYAVTMASGRTDVLAKIYWVELPFYVVVVLVLSLRYGVIGASIAWSLRVAIDAFIHFAVARRIAGVRYTQQTLVRFTIVSAVMLLPILVFLYYGQLNAVVVGVAVAAILAYTVLIYRKVLEREEAGWISNLISEGAARIRA